MCQIASSLGSCMFPSNISKHSTFKTRAIMNEMLNVLFKHDFIKTSKGNIYHYKLHAPVNRNLCLFAICGERKWWYRLGQKYVLSPFSEFCVSFRRKTVKSAKLHEIICVKSKCYCCQITILKIPYESWKFKQHKYQKHFIIIKQENIINLNNKNPYLAFFSTGRNYDV